MKFAKEPKGAQPRLYKADGQILTASAHAAMDKRHGRRWECTCPACAQAREYLLRDIICREVEKKG